MKAVHLQKTRGVPGFHYVNDNGTVLDFWAMWNLHTAVVCHRYLFVGLINSAMITEAATQRILVKIGKTLDEIVEDDIAAQNE